MSLSSYPVAKRNGHLINLDTIPAFGDTSLNGRQFKGAIHIAEQDVFVKLDHLNPAHNGAWENYSNYMYSSIAEAIASVYVKHMEKMDNFKSLVYEFQEFELRGKPVSGTLSPILFDERNQVERTLSLNRPLHNHLFLKNDDYAEMVVDVKEDKRLDMLVNLMHSQGVDAHVAREFLVQQAGFDHLTGNIDRLNNPSNFVMLCVPDKNTTTPINIDYGRCFFGMTCGPKFDSIDLSPDELLDDAKWYVQTSKADAIISKQDLHLYGFKPFVIDVEAVNNELDLLRFELLNSHLPCKNYIDLKINMAKETFNEPSLQHLFIDKNQLKKEVQLTC